MEGRQKKKTIMPDEVTGVEGKPKKKKPKPVEEESVDVGAKPKKPKLVGDESADVGKKPKRKTKLEGAEKTEDAPGKENKVQDGEGPPKKKKKKKKVDITEAEETFDTSPSTKDRRKTEPKMTETASLYEDALGTTPSYFGSNPMQEYRPPTLTGITELPVKDFFLMVLLWSPRFFGPWISAWHEFNVFILAPPDHLESKEKQLMVVDLVVFGVSCTVSILVSIIADLANMRYYVYLIFLFLYTLCPIAGGAVDVVLRQRIYDHFLYDYWFLSIVLMRAAIAIPFIFFPVQFTCIFTEKANMSRQAHYNWIAFFAFLEFVNAYASFWVIPPKCPTTQWNQMVVWVGILFLLWLLIVATIVFSVIVKSIRYTLMTCLKTCGLSPEKYLSDEYNQKIFEDRIPRNRRLKKLKWFGLMLLPLVFSSFVFATFERFVPDDDWDKHYVLSATSMFYLGRILGVVLMVVVLFWIRHGFKRVLRIPIFRGDVLVLGLPHLLNILALMTLVGRFATLSHLNPGDVIQGPVPDDNKTVVMFFNQMYRNKTVCVRSDHFRPVKIRAFHYATREIYTLSGEQKINFTVIPEPGANPAVATNFVMKNVKYLEKSQLLIYSINLFAYLLKTGDINKDENKYREYMNQPRVIRHVAYKGEDNVYRPAIQPRVIVINNFAYTPTVISHKWDWYFVLLFRYGEKPTRVKYDRVSRHLRNDHTFLLVKLPFPGKWYVAVTWMYTAYAKDHNEEYFDDFQSEEFTADNYTLYIASAHLIGPLNKSRPKHLLSSRVRVKVYTVQKVAGPGGHDLPSKRVLQRDWAIQMGMTLAGMSAGGLFVGTVYLFWMDPPLPGWQTTALAVFWTLMIGAAESPKVKLVDIGIIVSCVLLGFQIALTCVHVLAAKQMYTPEYNFRKRPD